jgi:hypothetical protein
MKSLSLPSLLLAVLMSCGMSSPAISQDANETSEDISEQNSAINDPDNRTGEPAHVTVVIKNVSGKDLLLRNIEIAESIANASDNKNPDRCEINQKNEILLRSGSSFEQDCQFHNNNSEQLGLSKRLRMSLLASKLKLVVMLDTKQLGKYRYYPSVSIQAQEYSIFIGGVFGAILLATFVWIERVLKNPVIRANVVKSLLPTALMGLRGGIMAIIALLLGRSSQSTGAPITLTVTDFTGGLLVGLFSYPLAAWIASALKIDELLLSSSEDKKKQRKQRTLPADSKDDIVDDAQQSKPDNRDIDQRSIQEKLSSASG